MTFRSYADVVLNSPSFIQAKDQTHSSKRIGENGAAELTAQGVEEDRVALFFALVRIPFYQEDMPIYSNYRYVGTLPSITWIVRWIATFML